MPTSETVKNLEKLKHGSQNLLVSQKFVNAFHPKVATAIAG